MPDLQAGFGNPDPSNASPPRLADSADSQRRRRTGRSVIAVLMIGVLAAWFTLTRPTEDDALEPAPPAASSDLAVLAYQVYDRNHALITYTSPSETSPADGSGCREVTVRVTADGGRTWSPHRAPAHLRCPSSDGPQEAPGTVQVTSRPFFSPRAILLAPDTILLEVNGRRFLSHDLGASWNEYLPQTHQVAQLPEAMPIDVPCDAFTAFDCADSSGGLRAIAPRTGDLYLLTGGPRSRIWDATQAADGSIWATTWNTEGKAEVWVSHDRGATWVTRPLPHISEDGSLFLHVTSYDGQTGYVLAPHRVPRGDVNAAEQEFDGPRLHALYRTADGGLSWELTHYDAPPTEAPVAEPSYGEPSHEPEESSGEAPAGHLLTEDGADSAVVLPDGTLLTVDAGTLTWYASADGGRSFNVIDPPVPAAVISWLPTRGFSSHVLPTETARGPILYFSEDGREWSEIPVP